MDVAPLLHDRSEGVEEFYGVPDEGFIEIRGPVQKSVVDREGFEAVGFQIGQMALIEFPKLREDLALFLCRSFYILRTEKGLSITRDVPCAFFVGDKTFLLETPELRVGGSLGDVQEIR